MRYYAIDNHQLIDIKDERDEAFQNLYNIIKKKKDLENKSKILEIMNELRVPIFGTYNQINKSLFDVRKIKEKVVKLKDLIGETSLKTYLDKFIECHNKVCAVIDKFIEMQDVSINEFLVNLKLCGVNEEIISKIESNSMDRVSVRIRDPNTSKIVKMPIDALNGFMRKNLKLIQESDSSFSKFVHRNMNTSIINQIVY